MFRLLDRYVLRECIGPFFLGLIVFTFMLLIQLMFRLAEMIIQRDVPVRTIGELLSVSLPNILVITTPMALLFAVLLAIGRLSSDSELVAMRASGISLFALYRPVMLFSLLSAGVTAWLMLDVMPKGNSRVDSIYAEIATRSVNKQVQPGVFYDGLSEKILFVFGVNQSGWQGVFISDSLPGREHDIQVAQQGRVDIADEGTRMRLQLGGTSTHSVNLADPDAYSVIEAAESSVVLEDRFLEREASRLENRSYKSMTISELTQWKALPKRTERERRQADVEIHQKFAIPAACLVFGLFAVPLGFNNRRGGRSSGFALSIPIILAYRILQSNGEGAAVDGKMDAWLAMWLPNIAFFVAGLFLLTRRNRDRSLLFSRLDRWVRTRLWGALRKRGRLRQRRRYRKRELRAQRLDQRQSATDSGIYSMDRVDDDSFSTGPMDISEVGPRGSAAAATADLVLRLPRLRIAFPTLIDRYLLSTFVRVFLLVVASGMTVYVLADLTELLDDMLDNNISFNVVLDYYQVLAFQIFKDLSPVVVLLTILIGFGVLSRTSEITAAKAAGLSLYRLSIPAVVAAALVCFANIVLEQSVLPYSNARAAELKAQIKGDEQAVRVYRRADRQWLYGQGGYIYHFQNYDPKAQRIQRLHVFHFDPETYALEARLYAQEALYMGDGDWAVSGAWRKEFQQGKVVVSENARDGQLMEMPEDPPFFDMEMKAPEMMPPDELNRYIEGLASSGQEVHRLEVQLFNKTAMPVISLVMAFVALPFAFRLGKKGALYGIGLAIGLGIVFYAIVAVFTTLGQAGSLPPLVAVWSPHVLFASMSLYLFLGIET